MQKDLDEKTKIRAAKSKFNAVFKLTSTIKTCPKCNTHNHKYKKGALKIEFEI